MEQWPAEVWNQYSESWASGFEVVEETERGYRLRRCSDGSMLPDTISRSDVRHEGHE